MHKYWVLQYKNDMCARSGPGNMCNPAPVATQTALLLPLKLLFIISPLFCTRCQITYVNLASLKY